MVEVACRSTMLRQYYGKSLGRPLHTAMTLRRSSVVYSHLYSHCCSDPRLETGPELHVEECAGGLLSGASQRRTISLIGAASEYLAGPYMRQANPSFTTLNVSRLLQ